jgi:hypothetical protein
VTVKHLPSIAKHPCFSANFAQTTSPLVMFSIVYCMPSIMPCTVCRTQLSTGQREHGKRGGLHSTLDKATSHTHVSSNDQLHHSPSSYKPLTLPPALAQWFLFRLWVRAQSP